MNLAFREIKDKNIWENFILKLPFYTFLQSYNWGEVEKKLGNEILRLGMFEDDELVGVGLLLKIRAKRGTFGYCPHGPLFSSEINLEEKLKFFFDYLNKWGKTEKLSFIRIGSLLGKEKEVIFKKLGLIKAPTHIYTDNFLILNLDKSEDELLREMRKTTRYLIKKGEKEDVVIKKVKEPERLKVFFKLLKKTAERQHFVAYPFNFLKEEYQTFANDNQAMLFEGWHGNEILAGAMIIFYGNSAFYHHGASIISKIPVSNLLQWEAIKEAKRQGKKFYNFWGFAAQENPHHPFYGITIFKKGFGPSEVLCCPNYDLVIRKSYWISYIIETIRKIKRGH